MKSLYIREGETELISVSSFCFRECSWALKFKMNNYCIKPFKFIYSLHFYAYSSKLTRLHWSQCKIQHYWFIFGEQSFSENNSLFCRFKILMKNQYEKKLNHFICRISLAGWRKEAVSVSEMLHFFFLLFKSISCYK